jgi:NAD(P)-dependent dehydrogenase (short-subunit alcohol dehydrogenase family)
VLVNNAGVDFTSDLLETRQTDVRRIFEANFFGAMWMLQRVARDLKRRGEGGSIVNITSRLASIGVPTMATYAASKGALLALTRAAAVELGPLGIRVNAVAPGPPPRR